MALYKMALSVFDVANLITLSGDQVPISDQGYLHPLVLGVIQLP